MQRFNPQTFCTFHFYHRFFSCLELTASSSHHDYNIVISFSSIGSILNYSCKQQWAVARRLQVWSKCLNVCCRYETLPASFFAINLLHHHGNIISDFQINLTSCPLYPCLSFCPYLMNCWVCQISWHFKNSKSLKSPNKVLWFQILLRQH